MVQDTATFDLSAYEEFQDQRSPAMTARRGPSRHSSSRDRYHNSRRHHRRTNSANSRSGARRCLYKPMGV